MTLPEPLIIINLKTYEAGTGPHAEHLVRQIQAAGSRFNAGIAVACQATDIFRVSQDTTLPLLAQHVDPVGYGQHTGTISMEAVQENGAVGTLVNHSEHRIPLSDIKAIITKSKRLNFVTVVCVRDAREAKKLAALGPTYLAVEPPELIGGTISVSTARPELITSSVKAAGTNTMLLGGAGVKTAKDIQTALELGAHGVLVASGVVQSPYPQKAMTELLRGTIL